MRRTRPAAWAHGQSIFKPYSTYAHRGRGRASDDARAVHSSASVVLNYRGLAPKRQVLDDSGEGRVVGIKDGAVLVVFRQCLSVASPRSLDCGESDRRDCVDVEMEAWMDGEGCLSCMCG